MPDNHAHVAVPGRRAGLVLAMLLSATTWTASASAQILTKFFEYPIPTTVTSFPLNPVAGPDGNLWFAEEYANKIAKMTALGAITEYPVPTLESYPDGLALGADGNLWFTENSANKIGRITTAGVITEFPIAIVGSSPGAITAGPDGNIWFGQGDLNIGCISLNATNSACPQSGGQPAITEFPLPAGYSTPQFMTSGPDGNIWFTEPSSGAIAKMTTAGSFTAYSSGLPSGSKPYGITPCPVTVAPRGVSAQRDVPGSSPTGCLWFTVDNKSKIGQITTAGTISTISTPTSASGPCCITVGPDNNLWFTENSVNNIAVYNTTTTQITEYPITTANSDSGSITSFNGALYFVEEAANKIGTSTIAGSITETPISTMAGSFPWSIRSGEPGALWFAEDFGNKIARITSGTLSGGDELATKPAPRPGIIKEYPLTTAFSHPRGIAHAPDGNMWFVEFGNNAVARITPTGVITEYPVPTSGSKPRGLTIGPDGNMWFTEQGGNNIGCISIVATDAACPQSGGQPKITEFPIPTIGAQPHSITGAFDGNVWFVEYAGDKIGCLSIVATAACPQSSGQPIVTEFNVPTPASGPTGITIGPDGALWFTEKEVNQIGRITTAGSVTNEYPLPTPDSDPTGLTAGPDGALWFTEVQTNKIGRMTVNGVVTSEYPVPTANSGPGVIFTGPDGALWFTEHAGNNIGRLVPLKLVARPGGRE